MNISITLCIYSYIVLKHRNMVTHTTDNIFEYFSMTLDLGNCHLVAASQNTSRNIEFSLLILFTFILKLLIFQLHYRFLLAQKFKPRASVLGVEILLQDFTSGVKFFFFSYK